MSTFATDSESARTDASLGIAESLDTVDAIIGDERAPTLDQDAYESLVTALQVVHARMRLHHAIGLDATESVADRLNAPELSSEEQRLDAEHQPMIGLIDRLIREAEAMADRSPEDQLVYTFRLREMVGIVRRHDAEDRRLLHLAVWRDTGGES